MSENQKHQNETISLVDLIAVVVRYRRLIFWGTIVAVVGAALLFYAGPRIGLDVGPQSEFTVERRVVVNPLPVELASHLPFEIGSIIQAVATDPRLVRLSFESAEAAVGKDVPPNRSNTRFSATIRRDVIDNSYRVHLNVRTDTITLSYTTDDREFGEAFLEEVIRSIGPELSTQVLPQIEEAAEVAQLAVSDATAAVGHLAATAAERAMIGGAAGGQVSSEAILTFLDNNGNGAIAALVAAERVSRKLSDLSVDATALFFPVIGVSVYEEMSGSRSKTVIMIGIAALFVVVFLAFFLEYTRRLKAEPLEMEKLKSAWRRE